MTSINDSSNYILRELYKTNLKFRNNNPGIIEILNPLMQPIAAIFPIYQHQPQSSTKPTDDPQ